MAKRVDGQISIFEFPAETKTAEEFESRQRSKWRAWLEDVCKVGAEGMALYDRMVEKFGQREADRRSKAISAICGYRKADGWGISDAAILGFEDPGVSCEVLWDRSYAAKLGMPRDKVAKLVKFVYLPGVQGAPESWIFGEHIYEE